MPPKKSSLGRNSKKAKGMKTRRQDEVFNEDQRRKNKARMAESRQQEEVKKRARDSMQARHKVKHAEDTRKQRKRIAYQQSKKKLEELEDDTIRAYQEAAYRRNLYKDQCMGTFTNSDEFWTLTEEGATNERIEAGKAFYRALEAGADAKRCVVCEEIYPFIETGPRNNKCKRCAKSDTFAKWNNLTPEIAPQCIKDLNQIEKAAISKIGPIIQVFTKGSSKATRGHCICVMQDVESFALKLPHLPKDLPYLYLKNPKESIRDPFFTVRREKIMTALHWLKENSPYYTDVTISRENAKEYPRHDILQTIPQADPATYNIPEEEPSACNEESAAEAVSTVDLPPRHKDAMEMFREALQPGQGRADEGQVPMDVDISEVVDALEAEDEQALNKSLGLDSSFQDQTADAEAMDWPKRGKVVSEYQEGFFAMAFPDLFPMNIPREDDDGSLSRRETGDITEPRRGKNPSLAEWFKHLLRYNRAFSSHHCFPFLAVNMLRRHMCITRGNVFAKHCTKNLTVSELKKAMEDGDDRVFRKLLHFASPIPATSQYMRHQSDLCLSYNRWLRIKSEDAEMFNFFFTMSAADLHWHDLHKILPGHEKYLDKGIDEKEDHRLRAQAVRENADLVDWYFHHRVEAMLKHVLPVFGVKEYIVRYEAQVHMTSFASRQILYIFSS